METCNKDGCCNHLAERQFDSGGFGRSGETCRQHRLFERIEYGKEKRDFAQVLADAAAADGNGAHVAGARLHAGRWMGTGCFADSRGAAVDTRLDAVFTLRAYQDLVAHRLLHEWRRTTRHPQLACEEHFSQLHPRHTLCKRP